MIEEITGPGHREVGRPGRPEKAKDRPEVEGEAGSRATGPPSIEVSGDLQQLIERVKGAQTYRKEVVHRVLEKLRDGELITSETVRETAEAILREGM